MTPKQAAFVDEYLKDLNASQAAVRAGYRGDANTVGPRLLANVSVRDAIAAAKAERSERTKIDADWVLRTLAEEKQADIADLFDDSGNLLPMKEWPKVWRTGPVVGLECFEEYAGRGDERVAVGVVRKVKLADRTKHLELIGRHVDVQAFKEKVEHGGPGGGPIPVAAIAMTAEQYEEATRSAMTKLLGRDAAK